jgi:hypothetical protein
MLHVPLLWIAIATPALLRIGIISSGGGGEIQAPNLTLGKQNGPALDPPGRLSHISSGNDYSL